MQKKLTDYPELKSMLYAILFNGSVFLYNIDNQMIQLATLFGYIKNIYNCYKKIVLTKKINYV